MERMGNRSGISGEPETNNQVAGVIVGASPRTTFIQEAQLLSTQRAMDEVYSKLVKNAVDNMVTASILAKNMLSTNAEISSSHKSPKTDRTR
jgi:hypothetical protein